ncbi:hypothetical protein ACVXHB_31435 [Escherichia coli]
MGCTERVLQNYGWVEIDNNIAENALREWPVGREKLDVRGFRQRW